MDLYLRIALELHLKRLVVGGMERVFEIGRVFRNEGLSPRHNPEFTMLELYQAYADYNDMMDLTEALVAHVAEEVTGTTQLTYGGRALDLSSPWRRETMLALVAEQTGVEVRLEMPVTELRARATELGVPVEAEWGKGKLILEIYEKTTEPTSGGRSSSWTTQRRFLPWLVTIAIAQGWSSVSSRWWREGSSVMPFPSSPTPKSSEELCRPSLGAGGGR